jgi:hypothetical protein
MPLGQYQGANLEASPLSCLLGFHLSQKRVGSAHRFCQAGELSFVVRDMPIERHGVMRTRSVYTDIYIFVPLHNRKHIEKCFPYSKNYRAKVRLNFFLDCAKHKEVHKKHFIVF